jgi:hypothetical protein
MPDFKVNPQPWMKAAVNVADDALVKSLVEDFRGYRPEPRSPLNQPSQTVVPVGAGKVVGGDDAPVASGGTGWADSPELKPPPGVALVDQLVAQQDLADFEARCREQASRMGMSYPDWLRLMEKDLRERRERREKAAKARKETPK